MWHALAWLVMGTLLALWSLGAWALHATVQWGAGLAAGGSGGVAREVAGLQPPEWLAVWLPAGAQEQWNALASLSASWVEYALVQAPDWAAWLSPAIWGVWALGAVLLLALGGGCSGLIHALGRRGKASPAMA